MEMTVFKVICNGKKSRLKSVIRGSLRNRGRDSNKQLFLSKIKTCTGLSGQVFYRKEATCYSTIVKLVII